MSGSKVMVEVDGRQLALTNLDKVLYPETGFTKGEVIDYYSRIASTMLNHLADRPLTVKRYPNGVEDQFFFEKNAPRHTPTWVRRARLPSPGSTKDRDTIDYALVDDLPTLVYYANLAALELHVPQWKVARPRRTGASPARTHDPDLLVFDLDPGAPADLVQCCEVALLLRRVLAEDGMKAFPKTSGKKGMQLYVPIRPVAEDATSTYARSLAQRLEAEHPDLVVSKMAKKLRPGKVFVDWSQNNTAKTTVAPYSLRAAPAPTVSTPLGWDEVEGAGNAADLRFTAGEVLDRVEARGDLFAPLLEERFRLP